MENTEEQRIEEGKKELREYRDNIKYIEQKKQDSEELRTLIEGVTKPLSDLPGAKGKNPDRSVLDESLDKISLIEEDCRDKLQELLLKKFAVENKIEQLEQPYRSALYLRYQRGMKAWQVAEELNYSKRHTDRILEDALKEYTNL